MEAAALVVAGGTTSLALRQLVSAKTAGKLEIPA
jgi:hypothetical protein